MSEPFGPEYVRPAQPDCPNCGCCSAALCERGRSSVMACEGACGDAFRDTVRRCPCSSDLTVGTMNWRLGRLRAAKRAAEQPFPPNFEAVLQAAAAGAPVDPDSPEAVALGLVHFLAPNQPDGHLVLTEFGRIYLLGRDRPQYQSLLYVVTVDEEQRLAEVLVTAWSDVTTVTIPADQVLSAVGGGKLSMLPGMRLMCAASAWAESAEDVIVTAVQVPPAAEVPTDEPPAPAPVPVAPAPEPVPAVEDQAPVAEEQTPAAEQLVATLPPGAPVMPEFPPVAFGLGLPPGVLPLSGRFVRVEEPGDPRV